MRDIFYPEEDYKGGFGIRFLVGASWDCLLGFLRNWPSVI